MDRASRYVLIDSAAYEEDTEFDDFTIHQFLYEDTVDKERFFVVITHTVCYSGMFEPDEQFWDYQSISRKGEQSIPDGSQETIHKLLESGDIVREYDILRYVNYDSVYPGYRETYEFAMREQKDEEVNEAYTPLEEVRHSITFLG